MFRLATLILWLLTLANQVCEAQTVKVMPFGASIVSRCWRANLQAKLKNAGMKDFDFVGSKTGTCGGNGVDQDHEGHPGALATDYAKNGDLVGWLNTNPPDVVLMLVGTNDVLRKKSTNEILAAYDTLLDQMRNKNPRVQIIFSNLLPLDPARFGADGVQGIKTLNAAIASYAPKKSNLKSPVYFVDNFTEFDPVKDTDDGEHPNTSTGIEKMAVQFFKPTQTAIKAARAVKTMKSRIVVR
ncbi:SGNH hydrolase [Decorospora gaudefroyi]|uniref:SGNH hydrolase n=1 Tax=Decorospora gaudefroyi TaxID=184978 RepID=A0A6A5KTC5_9PLEO|nr:SGNH hydrolase [Decorospora gaudefroyi]